MTWPRWSDPQRPPPLPEGAFWGTHPLDRYDVVWVGPDNVLSVPMPDGRTVDLPPSRAFPSSTAQDIVRNGGRWIVTRGLDMAWWIEENCTLPDGPMVGKPMPLLGWMVRRLLEKHEVHPSTGLRRFRWTLTGIGKKNSKTTMAAGEAHAYFHADDHPAPKIIVAASADHQADLVFGAAKYMAEQDGALAALCNAQHRRILSKEHSGHIQRIAAATGTRDGLSTSTNIFDELHTWLGQALEDQFTILSGATAVHPEAVNDIITTAGHNKESLLGRYYDHGLDIRDGKVEDDVFYFLWYEMPSNADISDESLWPLANPSIEGIPGVLAYLRDRLKRLTKSQWKRYHGNMWTEVEEVWDVAEWWDTLPADARERMDPNRPTFVAIDASIRRDTTAVVHAQLETVTTLDEDGTEKTEDHVYTVSRIWKNPYPPDDPRYDEWRVPRGELADYLLDLFDQYQEPTREDADGILEPGPAYFYDPAYFHWMADDMRAEGLNMLEYPQTDTRMIPASQTFYLLAKEGLLHHDGDPDYRTHVRNVVAKEQGRGWRMSKQKGTSKKIDGAISGGIAAHEAVVGAVEQGVGIW